MSRPTRITLLATAAAVALGFGSMIVFGFNAASLAVLVVAGPILLVAVAWAAVQWANNRGLQRQLFTALAWGELIFGAALIAFTVVRFPHSTVIIDVVFAALVGVCGVAYGITWLLTARKLPSAGGTSEPAEKSQAQERP